MSNQITSRNKPKDSQVLMEFFQGQLELEELTQHQKERLDRIRAIHAALLDFKGTPTILTILKDAYGLSSAQAYRDINLCHFIFGNMRKANKEMKRHRAEQMALETYNLAWEQQDTKGMAMANKNYIEASGISKEDPDLPDFTKLQPSVYPIIPDDTTKKLLEQLLSQKGALNLSKIMNEQAEDAEYTELTTRADQSGDPATS